MPKIKSINFMPNGINSNFTKNEIEFMEKYPNIFKLEYEPEPEPLKRLDGSLISEPPRQIKTKQPNESYKDQSEMLWQVELFYNPNYKTFKYEVVQLVDCVDETYIDFNKNNHEHQEALLRGLVFLPEDKELAEKKAKMLTKQLEIRYEIDRLNALEGWVADWNDDYKKKYHLLFNHNDQEIATDYNSYLEMSKQYMSKSTAETILGKYSQDELKQYLGIII